LAARAVAFESIDVANDADGLAALGALGLRTVPVVAVGEIYVFGQSIAEVAAFLGLDMAGEGPLPPAELADRLDRVLAAAARLLRQIPDNRIGDKLPNRDRSYRELGHHVFIIAGTFLDVIDGATLTTEALAVPPPAELRTGTEGAGFGDSVRHRVAAWWADAGNEDFTRLVPTYYGDQPLHDVMERTTWHAAQHVRQLAMVVENLGLAPDGPLTEADLAGLPVPEKVWDE